MSNFAVSTSVNVAGRDYTLTIGQLYMLHALSAGEIIHPHDRSPVLNALAEQGLAEVRPHRDEIFTTGFAWSMTTDGRTVLETINS